MGWPNPSREAKFDGAYLQPVGFYVKPQPSKANPTNIATKTGPQGTRTKGQIWDHAVSWGRGVWVSVSDIGRVGLGLWFDVKTHGLQIGTPAKFSGANGDRGLVII